MLEDVTFPKILEPHHHADEALSAQQYRKADYLKWINYDRKIREDSSRYTQLRSVRSSTACLSVLSLRCGCLSSCIQ